MPTNTKALVLTLTAVALSMAATLVAADSHPLAPSLSFTGLSGEKVSVDQFRGSVVLLNFWTTSCSVCLSEIPTLSALQAEYASQGLRVIGVALDDRAETVRRFAEQRHPNYTLALGNPGVRDQLGIEGFPVTFVIGRDGRMYSRHLGGANKEALENEVVQLLAADPHTSVEQFRTSQNGEPITLPTAAEIESEVPGVDLSQLTKAQVAELKQHLDATACPCGCNRSVLQCRSNHSSCTESKQLARQAAEKLRTPMI